MVMRKSSSPGLPYPPDASPPMPQDHLNVDSADLPPIPTFKAGSPTFNRQQYNEQENPWGEHAEYYKQRDKPLPPVLRAGNGGYSPQQPPMTELQESLQADAADNVTPRSSSESGRSGNFWDDDEEDEGKAASSSASQWQQPDRKADGLESIPLAPAPVKRKPVPSPPGAATIEQPSYAPPPPPPFASNNPFRRDANQEITQQPEYNAWEGAASSHETKGKEVVRDTTLPDGHQQNLMDNDSPITYPTMQMHASKYALEEQAWSQEPRHSQELPSHPTAPPPQIPEITSSFSSQPPLISVNTEDQSSDNPWGSEKASIRVQQPSRSPGASHEDLARYNDDLLDRGQETGVVSLKDELAALPNTLETPSASQQHLPLDGEIAAPPLPERPAQRLGESYEPPDGPPPEKPPRPSVVTTLSEAQVAKMQQQRNETYQIKHFNWFDHSTSKLRRSSMLTQNKNGPCPLLALVNALILGAKEGSQDAMDNALRAREQVSLGLIIETLMDELLSGGHEDSLGSLPDLDELNAFLMRLHTGMNANPRFAIPEQQPNLMDARNSMLHLPQSVNTDRKMGTFEGTQDIKLYSSFSIPLVHGWLPARSDPARGAFTRSAQTYEDAQALMFGEEELEYKLSNGGLSSEEQNLWQDITAIKNFLRSHPTQLSPFGLDTIQESLYPGSFAIMFRNDHFSTIYKHPETHQLFTLVTDAGYADRDEIVWESLVDVNGQDCEFFSGDFRHVGNNQHEAISAPTPGPRGSSLPVPSISTEQPISPQEQQEQHDADFAMALQLQEEEEQAARRQGNRPGRGGSQSNIPIPIRSRENQEVRPVMPPRIARSQNTGVNRPAAPDGEEAPPLYEEAVKGRPYIPPLGSPHHPTADPSPRSSSTQLTGVISNNDPPPPLIDRAGPSAQPIPRRPQRRESAYGEMSATLGGPGAYPLSRRQRNASYTGPVSPYGQGQALAPGNMLRRVPTAREERECIVM
jgi:ubiquitin carboxyl-terminal hydrolase MINDY-1/2